MPLFLADNKTKWTKCIMKHKKLQQLFCQFTDEIAYILEDELQQNSILTQDYLSYPHSNSRSPSTTHY